MNNKSYLALVFVAINLVACSEAPVDTSSLTTSKQNQNQNQNQNQTSPYSPYHPVMHDISNSDQNACSQAASAAVNYVVTCTPNGDCASAAAFGFCGLGPIQADKVTDAAFVTAAYSYTDVTFPKVIKAAGFLRHLYLKVLEREPDVPGFYYWMNDFFNNKGQGTTTRSVTYLADALLRVPAHAAYANNDYPQLLAHTYRALFNREPDQPGYDYYLGQLTSQGITADQFIGSLYLSTEFQAVKNDLGLQ